MSILLGYSKTILSAYTLYRHLGGYCTHPWICCSKFYTRGEKCPKNVMTVKDPMLKIISPCETSNAILSLHQTTRLVHIQGKCRNDTKKFIFLG